MTLPRVPMDLVRGRDAWSYGAIALWHRFGGRWSYPQRLSGDLESMDVLAKAYWLYKSSVPIRKAERGMGLEEFFAGQPGEFVAEFPADFRLEAEIRLAAAGDLISHPFQSNSRKTLYSEVAGIFDVDLAMANLECVVIDKSLDLEIDLRSGPVLVMDTKQLDVASVPGRRPWDFLSIANNHTLDLRAEGIASTVAALRERSIAFHGVNEIESEAGEAAILERRGVRIAIIAHTFGLNGRKPPDDRPRIVNRVDLNGEPADTDLALIEAQLEFCRRSEVDFVIAQLHWGMEFEFYPRATQIGMAHRIAELGADLIVGHHPHVIQPAEFYRTTRDPERVVPIYYSLGNLVNPFSAPWLCRSAVASLDLTQGMTGGRRKTLVRRASVVEVEQIADAPSRTVTLRKPINDRFT